MDINWDYMEKKVHVSMLQYVPDQGISAILTQSPTNATTPTIPTCQANIGATHQYAEAHDTLDPLSKEEKTYVQEAIGTFLYNARCVGASMPPALGTLATQQASPTKNTMKKIKQFLDFAVTHPDAVVTYHA
jgi:hypothetical protein